MVITTFEVPVMKMNRDNQTAEIYFAENSHLSLLRKYTEYVKDKSTDSWIPIEMAEWNLNIEIGSASNFGPLDINFSIPSSSKELKMKYIKSVEKPSDDGLIQFAVYELYTSDQEDL